MLDESASATRERAPWLSHSAPVRPGELKGAIKRCRRLGVPGVPGADGAEVRGLRLNGLLCVQLLGEKVGTRAGRAMEAHAWVSSGGC